MKDNKTKSAEDIIRGIKEYDKNYLEVDKDRLVLFAVDFLQIMNIEPTFDKIAVTSFKLFPKKFSLIGFLEYPDALTVDNCARLHNTRTKGWLSGSAQSGFKITEKGKYFLEETKKILKGKIKTTKTYATLPKRKEVTFINLLKKTKAFEKYIAGKGNEINKEDIKNALRVFKYADKKEVEKNFERYLSYARILDDKLVLEFLDFINKNKGRLI